MFQASSSQLLMPKSGEELSAVSAVSRFFSSNDDRPDRAFVPARVGMSEQKDLSKSERDSLAADIAKLTGCIIKAA